MIRKILSHTNPLVQHVVKLHQSKYRKEHNQFIAQGTNVIQTLIAAGHTPKTLFVIEDQIDHAKKIAPEDVIVICAPSVIQKMATVESLDSMLAIFTIPTQADYSSIGSGIVLYQLQNPGNAGTLIRTAVAMNKKTAIFVESVDPWSPKVIQASAGAVGMVNIFCMSWNELLTHKGNTRLCALILSSKNNPRTPDLSQALIVIGNEGHGIAREKVGQCEEKMTLSMPGNFESLNAAVAGSIALYVTSVKPLT
jgi:TrmH family RNA methyltransferase